MTNAKGSSSASLLECSLMERGLRALILAAIALVTVANGPVNGARHHAGPSSGSSGLDGRPIVIGTSYQLPSRVLGGSRRINVRLPDHYGEAGRSFRVLFLWTAASIRTFCTSRP